MSHRKGEVEVDADSDDDGGDETPLVAAVNDRLATSLRDVISKIAVGAELDMSVSKMKHLLKESGLDPAAVARLGSQVRKGSSLHGDWHKGIFLPDN